ncbi:22986_t:CDS:2 [Entrophospora sp. SA101]|nr:6441_t:CDS:2 [Entrophospora sp. SA101]CAJ0757654.1 22986_t:CDS:2 [Entrophospora sp. SA101]
MFFGRKCDGVGRELGSTNEITLSDEGSVAQYIQVLVMDIPSGYTCCFQRSITSNIPAMLDESNGMNNQNYNDQTQTCQQHHQQGFAHTLTGPPSLQIILRNVDDYVEDDDNNDEDVENVELLAEM